MATGRLPDPNTAPLTAKGDLYTYSTVPARLAVGSNGDTLVADSSASQGLRWQSSNNFNVVINGGMDVFQRGTNSGTKTTEKTFLADRWMSYTGNGGLAYTASQSTDVPTGFRYSLKIQRNSGNTVSSQIYLAQDIETVNSIPFANRTVTLSFWAKKGANYSQSGDTLYAILKSGTGTDQTQYYAVLTGQATVADSNVVLTSSWQRFSITGTVASNATQLGVSFSYTSSGTAGADDSFLITGIQLENGSVATTFKRAGNTLAGELAACQRYYFRNTTGKTYGTLGWAQAYSTTATRGVVNLPVAMRTVPTSVDQGNLVLSLWGVGDYTFTGLTLIGDNSTPYTAVFETTGATGLTAQRSYVLASYNNTAGYIGFSAEL